MTEEYAAVQTKVSRVDTLVLSFYMDKFKEQYPSQAFKNTVLWPMPITRLGRAESVIKTQRTWR